MAKKVTVADRRQGQIQKAIDLIFEGVEVLQGLYDEFEDMRSNLEEKFSSTDRYQSIEAIVDEVRSQKELGEEIISNLEALDISY